MGIDQERWGKVADCVICFNDSELVQMYLQRAKLKHELVKISAMDRPAEELEPEINKHNEKVEKFDEKLQKFKVPERSKSLAGPRGTRMRF